MSTPSVTLRSITNEDTGIDISVPRLQEEEAPLGGISILYEISVLTRLEIFKTRLHKSEDIVHFSIFKAYREVEDLHNKLNKKFPKTSLPPIPKGNATSKVSPEDKVKSLDKFMNEIARNEEICSCSIFTQFIGVDSQKFHVNTVLKNEPVDHCDKFEKEIVPEEDNTAPDKEEVFPKMKNVLSEKPIPAVVKNSDLFEEEKLENTPSSIGFDKNYSSKGLFDEFDDDCLFTTDLLHKPPTVKKEENKVSPSPPEIPKPQPQKQHKIKESFLQGDDSDIIIKNRKTGEVSLFSEQDFGDYITKEEELLFLVTSPEKGKTNALLSPENEILSPETDASADENLDDLLNLEPLPSTPSRSKKSEEVSEPEPEHEAPVQKPVPLPRKKSLGKIDTDSVQRPEVMPRKVFLTKSEESSKPPVASKPQVPAKPSLLPKPTPPPKPKPPAHKPKPSARALNANNELRDSQQEVGNINNELDDSQQGVGNINNENSLGELDILKYIEQEEKSRDFKLDLFD